MKGVSMKNAFKLAAGLTLFAAMPAWAQEAAAVAPVPNKGDTAWMMISTVLVMAMIVPGLALFYGGLVRTKNMASVLTQVLAVAALAMLLWVIYGYAFAFGGDANQFISSGKFFLAGVTASSTVATFTDGVVIPEFVFIAFQMTFSAITVALVGYGAVCSVLYVEQRRIMYAPSHARVGDPPAGSGFAPLEVFVPGLGRLHDWQAQPATAKSPKNSASANTPSRCICGACSAASTSRAVPKPCTTPAPTACSADFPHRCRKPAQGHC